jgi:uncharacterized membrane protein YhaH (DUF805 family)
MDWAMSRATGAGGIFGLLFGFRRHVDRRSFAGWGFGLLALKYGVDFLLTRRFASHAMGPLTYLNPLLNQRLTALGTYPGWLPVVMAIWALPFIWIGASMTARRAVDAGRSPWLCLLFFVPIVNYLVLLGLCLAPSRGEQSRLRIVARSAPMLQAAAQASLVAVAFGLLAVVFSVFVLRAYGGALFVGAPFVVGLISGLLFNRGQRRTPSATIWVATLSVVLCGGALLLFALEGVLCLAMAAVLALPLAICGGLIGRAWAGEPRVTHSMIVAWPLLALMPWDPSGPEDMQLQHVISSIEIAAPPERVWPNVVGFSELPPPSEWLLKTGIACPLRAHIVGSGVGAVRYCEFTTGPFVEPITAWEPPFRLAFDVARQPPSMREWSPYEVVHAPHLLGGMQSLHGEFRIRALPNGRSLLQGSTWYRLTISPAAYWTLYSDLVVHVIHSRVLRHVRALSEAPPR